MSAEPTKEVFAAAFKNVKAAAEALKKKQAGETLTPVELKLVAQFGGEKPKAVKGDAKTVARDMLATNLRNLQAKIDAGGTLTTAEIKAMEEAAESSPDPATAAPRWVKNKVALGKALGVDRRTINNWTKRGNAPKRRANGNYNVEEWRAFAAGMGLLPDEDLDHAALKARQILLQNKLLQQKIDVNDRLYVLAESVEQEVASLIGMAKTVLLSGPASLAPQVVGVSVQEAETLLKEWLHSALSKLQKNPLGKAGQ